MAHGQAADIPVKTHIIKVRCSPDIPRSQFLEEKRWFDSKGLYWDGQYLTGQVVAKIAQEVDANRNRFQAWTILIFQLQNTVSTSMIQTTKKRINKNDQVLVRFIMAYHSKYSHEQTAADLSAWGYVNKRGKELTAANISDFCRKELALRKMVEHKRSVYVSI